MADIQSNIQVNIDTSSALASIKALQGQISAFQKEMASSSAANALVAKNLQKALIDDVNATGKFSASIKTVTSTTDYFTRSLEKNKLSLGEYFRYGMASSKSFSRMFQHEFETINKVARERVKDLQTQYISLGKDASGATKAIAIRPLALDLESVATKAQMAAQRTQLFNQILKQGSTNLLNFGKNTQWAGRQLMVGFTIPLSIFGAKAAQEFKKLEEQSIRFKRVYGDSMTTPEQADEMIQQLRTLGLEFTKYGVALEQTMELAANAAAMGKTGQDLLAQVSQANILGVLGQVNQEQALETTISLTNAFGYSVEQLTNKVNFLNAVENQTVLSIEDLTTAIPKAGPVVQQLGGDVEDLAFFMTAMKEGGINASEGANALKSGLASLINPTDKASNMLLGMGINLREIVSQNEGNVAGVVVEFAKALDTLDPTTRAQAIEQLFGKFQFSRLSTLFQNVIGEGTQAQRVLEITNMTTAQLAAMSRKELGQVEQSALYKFQAAIERFNAALAPVGEQFMKMVTPLIDFGTRVLTMFDNMSDGAKGFVTALIGIVGGIAPIFIMTFGLVANAIANGMKGFLFIKNAIQGAKEQTTDLGLQTQYMSTEQLEAATIAASLDQVHSKLVQTFTSEAGAIDRLRVALERAAGAQARFGGASVARGAAKPKNFANGGMVVSGPGGPKGDKIPANLSDGEVVLSAETVKENPGIVGALLAGGKIKIPGFVDGGIAGERMHSRQAPGGYEQAHFSGYQERTGREILSLAKEGPNLYSAIFKKLEAEAQHLGLTMEQVMDHVFQAYDNRVVQMSASLNNAFGQSGMGGGVEAGRVKSEFSKSREQAHGMIASQLERNGVAPDEIKSILTQLADQVDMGLSQFGDEVEITGEDLDNVITAAYEAVSKGNDKLKKAYDELSEISGFASTIRNAKGGNSITRLSATDRTSASPFYKADAQRRKNFEAGIKYSQNPDVSFFPRVSKREIPERYTPAFDAIRQQNPEAATAIIQEEDKRKRLMMIEQEAHKLGIQIAEAATGGVADGIRMVTDQQSPSKEADKLGRNTGQGYLDGAKSKVDDARTVGEQTGDAMAKAAASKANLYGSVAPSPELKAARRKYGSVDNIPPAVLEKLTTGLTNVGDATEKASMSIGSVANRAMAASGALSSAVFMLQGFGIDLGVFGDAVGTLSNAMFALAATTQLVSRSQTIMSALNVAGIANLKGFTGLFKGAGFLGGIKNVFNAIKTFGGALTGLSRIVFRFIPYVGWALLAFEGFKILADQITISNQKLTGLGDVANLTAEKLAKIGNAFGFDPAKATNFGERVGTNDSGAGGSNAQSGREKLLSGYEGEKTEDKFNKFKEDYQAEINGLSKATAEQATRALSSTARQLYASGATQEAVDATIRALIEATTDNPELQKVDAGKIINTIFDPTKADSLQGIQDAAKKSAEAFQKAYTLQLATDFGSSVDPEAWQAGQYDPTKVTQADLDKAGIKGNTVTPLSTEAAQEMSILAAETAASANALYQSFDLGTIGADQLIESVNGLIGPIEGLSETAQARLIPVLVDELGPEFKEQTKDIKDYADVLYMAKYVMAGGVITEEQLERIKKNGNAVGVLSGTYGKLAKDTEAARKAEEKRQAAVDNAAYVKAQISGVQDQINSYNILRDAGFSAAEALAFTNDETIRSAVLAAGSAAALGDLKDRLVELSGLQEKWSKISGAGAGGGKKSPFQEAIDSLKEQKTTITNAASAYSKLRKANMNVATSWKYANDATVAAGLASAKTTTQIKKIVAAIKELEKQTAKNAWGNFTKQTEAAKTALANQSKMATILGNIGASAEEIDALINDENLAAGFKAGTVTAKQLEEALKKIRANADIELKIKMATPEGMQSIFDDAYSKVQEAFSAQETQITLDFKLGTNLSGANKDLINTDEIDKVISDAEDQIADLNYQIDDYEAGIQQIAWQEEAINDKYDARGKALDKIQRVNDAISRQNKAQLTIADALSQGDIAAAAKAIEDARAEDAAAAIDAQKQALDTAKEQELAALTDAQGRTRQQLEASILDLKKQIFAIEEQTLEPAQKAASEAAKLKQAAIDSITVLGKNKDEWEAIKNKIDMARVNSTKYKTAIKKALDLVTDIVAKWSGLDGKVITTTHVINTINNSSNGSGGSGGYDNGKKDGKKDDKKDDNKPKVTTPQPYTTKRYIGSTLENVRVTPAHYEGSTFVKEKVEIIKTTKKAGGGIINWRPSGTDTVPAMLTPGEFVMKKSAVGKYGVGMMRAINSGRFVPEMSAPAVMKPVDVGTSSVSNGQNSMVNNNATVYNYNLSVNVSSSNAGAQEIANAVMGKIRSVDSQRVRGVRI